MRKLSALDVYESAESKYLLESTLEMAEGGKSANQAQIVKLPVSQ